MEKRKKGAKKSQKTGKTGKTGKETTIPSKKRGEKAKKEGSSVIEEKREIIEYRAVDRDKSLIRFRLYPNVPEYKEDGLILLAKGYRKSKIGTILGRTHNWYHYHYDNDIEFRRYADRIQSDMSRRIVEDAVNLADKMFDVLDAIAGDCMYFEKDQDRVQGAKLALDFLVKSGRLPKSNEMLDDEQKKQEIIEKISDIFGQVYGEAFRI